MPPTRNNEDEFVITSRDVWTTNALNDFGSVNATGGSSGISFTGAGIANSTATTSAEEIAMRRSEREEQAREFTRQLARLQSEVVAGNGSVRLVPTSKKKNVLKELDEISKKNVDVFSEVTKLQNEIDTISNERVNEMMLKYDTLIFRFIHKGYSVQGKSVNTIKGYLNTLQQSLLYYINEYFGDVTDLNTFTNLMLAYFSPDTNDPQHNLVKELAKDLFRYKYDLEILKKEKHKVIGIKDSKPTVCEDYLDFNSRHEGERVLGGGGGGRGFAININSNF